MNYPQKASCSSDCGPTTIQMQCMACSFAQTVILKSKRMWSLMQWTPAKFKAMLVISQNLARRRCHGRVLTFMFRSTGSYTKRSCFQLDYGSPFLLTNSGVVIKLQGVIEQDQFVHHSS